MKKFYLIAAAAAAVLAAGCAKNEVIQNQGPGDAISFGVYTPKAAVTKAVSTTASTEYGTIDLDQLKQDGFGVFAFYTNDSQYNPGTSKPNFMYNENITWDAVKTKWTYSPVKYWPNEHGASANSETRVDYLSFIAYAPYATIKTAGTTSSSTVTGTDSNASTEGIIHFNGNDEMGDIKLKFKVPASTANQVDLLYGTLGALSASVQNGNEGALDQPMTNLTKEKINSQVNIKFKHALSKFAFNIHSVIDEVTPGSNEVNTTSTTKIVVKSLTLKGTNIGSQGVLNLRTGVWDTGQYVTGSSFEITPLPTDIAVTETPTTWSAVSGKTGILHTPLANSIDVMLIPYFSDPTKTTITGIDIVYYVCTEDEKLNSGVSIVENHIVKNFADAIEVTKGYQYNITVRLGLTSVQLTADVSAWENGGTTPIDLPINVAP